jgi:hypothetical protein
VRVASAHLGSAGLAQLRVGVRAHLHDEAEAFVVERRRRGDVALEEEDVPEERGHDAASGQRAPRDCEEEQRYTTGYTYL